MPTSPADDYETIAEWIEHEHGHQPSAEDQVNVAEWFYERGLTPTEEKVIRTGDAKSRLRHYLDHGVKGVLQNLVDLGVLNKTTPGPDTFILHERTEEYLMGEDVNLGAYVDEEISRFLDDLHTREEMNEAPTPIADGSGESEEDKTNVTLRTVAADELDLDDPNHVEAEITSGDEIERMTKLDNVVGAIKSSQVVSKGPDYDQIGFRRTANRYQLSRRATRIIES